MASTSGSTLDSPPLGKYLASTGTSLADKRTRDKAIKSLSTFLSNSDHAEISQKDMSKLWKGIFYCFWMSDKPLVQQALATELAELLLSIEPTTSSLDFLEGFWECLVREWSGIDRLRIDKYYMLIRRYVNASFRLLKKENWNVKFCQRYNDILTRQGGPLCPTDNRVPPSLAYHLCDIYLEELNKIIENAEEESSLPAPLTTLVSPFITLAARTPSNHTFGRVRSTVMDPLFDALVPPRDETPPSQKKRRLLDVGLSRLAVNSCLSFPETEGPMDVTRLRKGLLKSMFAIASDSETRDSNRRKLYGFWRQYAEEDDDDSDRPIDAS
ncbi:ribosomal RNA processing protein [Amylostereum chailletii]|nr:ribosomal RNA processing protein [Amylostereum chailletii]